MTKYTLNDQTLALAGVFQAAQLVQQVARSGKVSGAQMESSLETLFKFDSRDVIDVYGDVAGVSLGLKTLCQQMGGEVSEQDMEITRYVIALLHLEKKLRKHSALLEKIASGLQNTQNQMEYFSLTHENVLANLGSLYQETVSTLLPRIIVQGEQNLLSQQSNANKIRAILLAGIRSAFLWHQTGGNKLKFLFMRKKYLQTAQELLSHL